jgi:hypothetical protein
MENIIEKLKQIESNRNAWNNWSLEEIQALLQIYLIISRKESQIFKLIYKYHGCDSWEDIFRDYDQVYLDDKTVGVEIALEQVMEEIKEHETHHT